MKFFYKVTNRATGEKSIVEDLSEVHPDGVLCLLEYKVEQLEWSETLEILYGYSKLHYNTWHTKKIEME